MWAAVIWAWAAGCGGEAVTPEGPDDAADSVPVVSTEDSDGAADTVEPPADTVDTPADTPEVQSCTDMPAELWCGQGTLQDPFMLMSEGQEVELEAGGQGLAHFYGAIMLRNSDPNIRMLRRVTDVETGELMHETRLFQRLVPLAGGEWRCEGYASGLQTPLSFQGRDNRGLQEALCGREVLVEMASEDPNSPADAPVVFASGSVHVTLRPDPRMDPPVVCD